MRGFRIVAIAGLDSAYRCSTSMFALIPSMHLWAKTRATFASSSMFWESRWDMTVIIVQRSRFECVFATVIATSFPMTVRSEEHTSELQSHSDLVCRLLLE